MKDEMRDRLIKLLKNKLSKHICDGCGLGRDLYVEDILSKAANYLITNGVTLPELGEKKNRKNYYRCCENCEKEMRRVSPKVECRLRHRCIKFTRLRALFCSKYIDREAHNVK